MLLLSQFACNALWQPAPGNFPGGGSGDMGLPPTVLLSSPEDETELIHSDILFLSGSISDPDSSLEQLSLSLISDLSGELDADFQFAGGGNFGGLVDLEVGEHTLTITVVDEFDHADSVSFAVTKLANRTPSTPEIILSPEDAVVGEELTVLFSTESVDPDGEEVFYSYNWFRNDQEEQDYVGVPNIPDGVTSLDDVWRVEVRATDEELQSDLVSAEVTISSEGPIITIQIEPFGASGNDDLTCAYTVIDSEGAPITEEEATWLINGTEVGDATQPLTSGYLRDDQVTCRVRAVSSVEKTRQETIVIENAVPIITSIELSPTTVREETTITCTSEATDADNDAVSLTTTWYVNGSATIVGNSLNGDHFDKGDQVYCEVRADDGQGGISNATSSQTVTVLNTAPSAAVLDLSPDPAFAGDTLTCSQTTAPSDPDPADTLTITTAWSINGTVDSAATGSTYDTSGLNNGDIVRCTVSADDGVVTVDASASVTLTERLSGKVYGYQADAYVRGSSTNGYLGNTVVNAGDVDGDGDDDLLVGASQRNSNAGAVFLFSGANMGTSNKDTNADYWWSGSSSSRLGGSPQGIAVIGDTDSDGGADLLMSAPKALVSSSEEGEAYLFETSDMSGWGQGNAPDAEATAVFQGAASKDRLGSGIGGADIDGDGVPDVLIAISYDDTAGLNSGAVAVYLGGGLSGTLSPSDADYTLTGDNTGDRLGLNAVHSIGDVDGDGTVDVFIGSQNMDASATSDTGVAFIISSADVTDGAASAIATQRIEGINSNDSFGDSAAPLGDLDGDGKDDFAIGARFGDADATDGGSVYFWFGSTTTGTLSASTADASWGSSHTGDRLGWEMSSGDLDSDGDLDLLAGAYRASFNANSNTGEAFVVLGSGYTNWATGGDIDDDDQVKLQGNVQDQYAGRSATVISDINGDGYSEWVVGGQGKANGSTSNAGAAYIFYGP